MNLAGLDLVPQTLHPSAPYPYSDTDYRLLTGVEQVTSRPMHEVLGELISRPSVSSRHGYRLPVTIGVRGRAHHAPRDGPLDIPLAMASFRVPRVRTPSGEVPTLVGHSGSTGSWLFHRPQLDLPLSGSVHQATAGAVPFRSLPKILNVVGRAAS